MFVQLCTESNDHQGVALCLRESMLKVMEQPQFAHPVFWAPYALVGNAGAKNRDT
jgi:CHAT domain-containing protein